LDKRVVVAGQEKNDDKGLDSRVGC
jgi:hypothetical protein